MKKKHSNIILSVTCLIIWGIIVFKFFDREKKENRPIHIESMIPQTVAISTDSAQQLLLNYPDPFQLKTKTRLREPVTYKIKKRKSFMRKKTTIKTETRWPDISFKGSVTNKEQKQTIAILNINKKSHRVKQSETINKIKIVRIWSDSILLSLENDVRTYSIR